MMKSKRWATLGSLGLMTMLLTACSSSKALYKNPPTGFLYGSFYKYIGVPIQHLLDWLANIFGSVNGSGYGIAILVITLVVRLVLMPSMLKQQRNMTESQEKAKVLKPQLTLLQRAGKVATDQAESMRINGLMQDVYKKNGSKMIPSMGCLVLLIQLPIFSGLYQAVAYSEDIYKSVFFGIKLGTPSLLVTLLATALYLVQGGMTLITAAPEQRKTMMSMTLFSPLFTFMISINAPAGLALYFFGTGLIMVVQQAILTFGIIPSIRKRLDAQFAETPVVEVVTPDMFDEDGRINDNAPMPESFAQIAGMGMGAQQQQQSPTTGTTKTTVGRVKLPETTEDDLRARNAGKQKRD